MSERGRSFRPETAVAIEAVRQALTIARKGLSGGKVTAKGERDLVTDSDVAIEEVARRILVEGSQITVIGEEQGGEPSASRYWLVDPICGTRNFASGVPLYCVNIALVEGGEISVAVVGDPSTDGIDVAERGEGAWRLKDGARTRLAVGDRSRTVVVEDGKSNGERRERAARFTAAVIRADRWDMRSLGTTLACPYVAAGRVAAYAVFWVSALHAGAGALLIAEAGGTVSDIDGGRWTIESDSLVGSANDRLHDELIAHSRAAA
jgi:myo-inositol-1(or 4)-monophosphatase